MYCFSTYLGVLNFFYYARMLGGRGITKLLANASPARKEAPAELSIGSSVVGSQRSYVMLVDHF